MFRKRKIVYANQLYRAHEWMYLKLILVVFRSYSITQDDFHGRRGQLDSRDGTHTQKQTSTSIPWRSVFLQTNWFWSIRIRTMTSFCLVWSNTIYLVWALVDKTVFMPHVHTINQENKGLSNANLPPLHDDETIVVFVHDREKVILGTLHTIRHWSKFILPPSNQSCTTLHWFSS